MRAFGSVLILILAAGSPRHSADAPSAPTPYGRWTADVKDTTDLIVRFAGCYRLHVVGGSAYHIQLLTQSLGPSSWRARSLDRTGGANTAGDTWSWAPLNTTRILISWGGIDGAMEFDLNHRTPKWTASAVFHTANNGRRSDQHLDVSVRRTTCLRDAA